MVANSLLNTSSIVLKFDLKILKIFEKNSNKIALSTNWLILKHPPRVDQWENGRRNNIWSVDWIMTGHGLDSVTFFTIFVVSECPEDRRLICVANDNSAGLNFVRISSVLLLLDLSDSAGRPVDLITVERFASI